MAARSRISHGFTRTIPVGGIRPVTPAAEKRFGQMIKSHYLAAFDPLFAAFH